MSYTPTLWVDGETPVNATNMNKIEQGIVTLERDFNNAKGTLVNEVLAALPVYNGEVESV